MSTAISCDESLVPLAEVIIHDIINGRKKTDRKLEAEEKRQVDLQRIRDMKSTAGVHPLQLLPKEMWMEIFKELKDSGDLRNGWQAHPMFMEMMEKARIRDILLPQIIQLDEFQRSLRSVDNFTEQQLRRISRSAKLSFDSWREDRIMKRVQSMNAHLYPHLGEGVNIEFYTDSGTLEHSLASFEMDSKPALLPWELTISYSDWGVEGFHFNFVDYVDQFQTGIQALLERFGSQIWHFKFYMENLQSVHYLFSRAYIMFHRWISLMPKLKWLEMYIQHPERQRVEHDENGEVIDPQNVLRQYPFPTLANLERLSFHSNYHESRGTEPFPNFYEIVLGANQHVKMLDLTDDKYDWDASDLHILPAQVAQSLHLKSFSVCGDEERSVGLFTTLRKILPFLNYDWPLQQITLGLRSNPKGEDTLNALLRVLEKFPTLGIVKLGQLENFRVGDTDGYLKLPNLKDFELELTSPEIDYESNIHFFFTLQFLLFCEKLERISWKLNGFDKGTLWSCLKKYEDANPGNVVEFRAGLRYLYDSNIWQVFPSLEKLKVWISFDGLCEHEYNRSDMRSASVERFLENHRCSRNNSLEGCAVIEK